jgi:hypothetical protein
MTPEERKELEKGLFKKQEKKTIEIIEQKENIIEIAIISVPFLFAWWSDMEGTILKVYENTEKEFYITVDEFDNYGILKQCLIPKNVCQTL